MATSGRFVFFPWLILPKPVLVGGFRFIPVDAEHPGPEIGKDMAATAKLIFSRYVDVRGNPIRKCTVALRPRHSKAWDIPESLLPRLFQASECLALAVMAEQRFFEPFKPHVNATLFRPIVQGVTPGQDEITFLARRRDGGVRISGLQFKDVIFPMPLEVYETACPEPSLKLASALDRARTSKSAGWAAIRKSLPFFLLGHSDTREMPDEACVLLSALAFERLLGWPSPQLADADKVSQEFAKLWSMFARIRVADAKRVAADPHAKHGPAQSEWPLHRKWIKELYEARSELAHGGSNPNRSSNWNAYQHLLYAAFAFPLSVKLRLAAENRYSLSTEEHGACKALDELLDSGWRSGGANQKWSRILSMSEALESYNG